MEYNEYKFEPGDKGEILEITFPPRWLENLTKHTVKDKLVLKMIGKLTPITKVKNACPFLMAANMAHYGMVIEHERLNCDANCALYDANSKGCGLISIYVPVKTERFDIIHPWKIFKTK